MTDASTRRWIGVLGLAVAVAAASAGCTAGDLDPTETIVPSASSPAGSTDVASASDGTADAERMPRLSDVSVGTVIATGEFTGGATGRIEILANGSDRGFDVSLTDVAPAPPATASLELNALPSSSSEDELRTGYSYYRYDALRESSDQAYSTPGEGYGGFETNDPTYMRTAIMWQAPPGAPIGLGEIIATADLAWKLPDMNPGLGVVDRGAADGARGRVALTDSGEPWRYRVVAGDTANAVTERFGITERDLEWLNPDRERGRLILADVTLNLSRDSRGLRG